MRKIMVFKKNSIQTLLILSFFVLFGCSKAIHPVKMVIHSDPQGGHVLYKPPQTGADWIYLGATPVKTVRMVSDELMTEKEKFVLRILRDGFHEQIKEWDGETFLDTFESQGEIFWTPHLIRSKP